MGFGLASKLFWIVAKIRARWANQWHEQNTKKKTEIVSENEHSGWLS